MLDITIGIALLMLTVAALLTLVRVVRGPTLPDRVVAIDLIGVLIVGVIVVSRCRHGRAGLPRRGDCHRADQFRRHRRLRAIRGEGRTTMTDWVSGALLVAGATLALLAAVGVLRMPDVFTRMQAST